MGMSRSSFFGMAASQTLSASGHLVWPVFGREAYAYVALDKGYFKPRAAPDRDTFVRFGIYSVDTLQPV